MEKSYENDDIIVVWKPNSCIHSTICWKELREVFNPKERPWVKLEGSSTERIIEQVRKCPSGALSYIRKKNAEPSNPTSNEITAETAHLLKITVSANGPYIVNNECVIIHSDGREETKTGTIALCRCGASSKKPYCDGTHGRIGFDNLPVPESK